MSRVARGSRVAAVVASIAALAIVSLVSAASAVATTRYVSKGGKDTSSCTLAEPCLTVGHVAEKVAQAGDTVEIGPGTFTEHFTVEKALNFVGAGAGTASSYDPLHDTLIDGSTTSGDTIFDFAGGSFSDLRVNGGHGGFEVTPALYLQASGGKGSVSFALNNVVATQPPRGSGGSVSAPVVLEAVFTFTNTATITGLTSIGDGIALNLADNGTMSVNLSSSTLTSLAESTGEPAFGVGTAQVVADHTTVGGTGVGAELFGTGALTATASSFSGKSDGIKVRSTGKGTAAVSLRDSLAAALPTAGPGAQAGALLLAEGGAGSIATLNATNSTIAAYGKGTTAGLQLESKAGASATAQLANTIAFGADPAAPGTPRDILAAGPGGATVSAQSSGYSTVGASAGATITPPGSAGNVIGDPGFVAPAAANFMLTSASPLLERGDPAFLLAGELDLAGVPRVQSGCGSSTLKPDVGAYELLRSFACPELIRDPGPAVPPIVSVPTLTPTIGSASITAPLRARHGKRAKPGKLVFTLNEAATVNVALKRLVNGHLRKRACVAKAKACKRLVTVAGIHLHGKADRNTIAFPSLKLAQRLPAASYEVLLVAVNSRGTRSTTRAVKFKLR